MKNEGCFYTGKKRTKNHRKHFWFRNEDGYKIEIVDISPVKCVHNRCDTAIVSLDDVDDDDMRVAVQFNVLDEKNKVRYKRTEVVEINDFWDNWGNWMSGFIEHDLDYHINKEYAEEDRKMFFDEDGFSINTRLDWITNYIGDIIDGEDGYESENWYGRRLWTGVYKSWEGHVSLRREVGR